MKSDPNPQPSSHRATTDLHDAIRRRAEEIYIRNGKIPGRDKENWAQAEMEVYSESAERAATQAPRRNAVIVKVDGVQYVGEYDVDSADGYTPGELTKGFPVSVRFVGDKMFVKRPNGKELETKIVNKTG